MSADPTYFLSGTEFFGTLTTDSRRKLADICLPKSLKKKEILFLEGDRGVALYLCARGTIQLYKQTSGGQETVIKIIRPGELFAEIILFEKERYPVSAMALEDSLVYILPRAQFECLLENSGFRKDFLGNLMGKLRYLAEQVQYLTAHDAEARFFRFLKQLGIEDGKALKITLSKKDMAAAIGATPETFSRLIQRLTKEKKIIWKGREIIKKK